MKKTFSIEVDCPVCADKCQRAIAAVDGVRDCQINFILQKLTLEADDDRFDEIVKEAVKAAKKAEADFEMEV
ncbi:MAG: cation transporter [Oscillospiraceae bacterium]|nr:cation transporter [Oscillospiraceae bacterium]MBR2080663.1 cation transporter [Oscillospiraceae bacterium]MBR2365622.1 cation transporter [Oscillospiraceae bacterium]MBR2978255.1 cation transporter [Oscillospiraceae bacterium]MBR3849281.1 cation transporter [Oscillospiraceae bacterium]